MLPLAKLQYPYQNIAAVFEKSQGGEPVTKVVKQICPELSIFKKQYQNSTLYLISELPTLCVGKNIISFSGKCKYKDKFIYGQSDFDDHISINKIRNEVGYFCIFSGKGKNYEIDNDFFGTYPLYRYTGEQYDVVSNSYHLLILIIKGLGIELTLDPKTIIPYFVTGQRMLFEQLASHSTFIKEIKKVPIHSKCIVDLEKGIILQNNLIGKMLKKNMTFSPIKYDFLIRKTAKEIIKNIQIIDEDKRVNTIVEDVSGGKDSRVVLGALLDSHARKQIYVFSKDVKEKQDKSAFIPLNNLHQYQYDTEIENYKETSIAEKLLERRSICLGTFFSLAFPGNLNSSEKEKVKRIRFTGAGGDMLLCPYFPMSFDNISYESLDALAETLAINYNNGISDFTIMKDYIVNIIKDGISETYGKTLYDKFNNYYLYFRNVYHFGPEVMLSAFELGEEKWTPLYSKNGFIMRQMCSHIYSGIRIALDLLMYLNPVLLKTPFNSAEYNEELRTLVETDKRYRRLEKIEVNLSYDETKWNEASIEKNSNKKVVIDKNVREANLTTKNNYFSECFYRLNKILHNNEELREVIGMDVYLFLKKHSTDKNISKDIHFLYNKISTVYDLQNIIKG